jgi:hypothetical protein
MMPALGTCIRVAAYRLPASRTWLFATVSHRITSLTLMMTIVYLTAQVRQELLLTMI